MLSVTELLMAHLAGLPLSLPCLSVSPVLYVPIGCCWLPVVWLQIRMRNIAVCAARKGSPLPELYHRYYRWWFGLGWPAFIGVLAVLYLMVAKPG